MFDVGLSSAAEGEEAEKTGFFRGNADRRDVQVAPDDRGDVAERHPLVGDAVQTCSRGRIFERQPVQVRSVEGVHAGPAVGTVGEVAGLAGVTGRLVGAFRKLAEAHLTPPSAV